MCSCSECSASVNIYFLDQVANGFCNGQAPALLEIQMTSAFTFQASVMSSASLQPEAIAVRRRSCAAVMHVT